ncbi:hypothetical protein ANO11243_058760 [Dothideomycetidae sp. 11243]|nr:hypothetical protein ANO11243_058760 [fungal sp. No.11243]
MIHSGLKSAARALPHQQLSAVTRAGAITCSASAEHIGSTARSGHQRRHSSSKASCPPGDRSDSPRPAAPAVKAADSATTTNTKSAPPRSANGRQHGSRSTRSRKSKDEVWASQRSGRSSSVFSRLPSVPDTALSEKDLKLSSLFALHRPLSLAMPIPPTTEQAAFDRIFESATPRAAHPADVVSTLTNTIESLENARPDGDLHWQVIQESASNSDGVRHLDSTPTYRPRTVEELVAQMKPYEKPPVPTPILSSAQQQQHEGKRSSSRRKARGEAVTQHQNHHQRAFETTVIIREHGPKMYSAELTSIKQLAEESQPPSASKQLRMAFGTRVRVNRVLRATRRTASTAIQHPTPRQRMTLPSGVRWQKTRNPTRSTTGTMHAISVKRQRKLKMKKHKYKKLMKRTRNLRRRLEK